MSVAGSTTPSWSEIAVTRLRDAATCPVCGLGRLSAGRCPACGAELSTALGTDLWNASLAAADALARREDLRRRVPRTPVAHAQAPLVRTTDVARASAGVSSPRPAGIAVPQGAPRGNTSVQSLLAIAGAGLFAVAAIVFTFFNPDLRDHATRSIVTLVVTAVFLVGARMLARHRLRASAEAVGALGMVFVALDVYAFAGFAPAHVSGWVFAGVGTIVAALVMIAVGARVGIRSWVAVALLGLAFAPAMLGAAESDAVARVAGWLATMAAGLALVRVSRRLEPSMRRPLRAERRALTVVQLIALAASALTVFSAGVMGITSFLWLAAGAAAAGAAVARLSAQRVAPALWSFLFGGAATIAATATALALLEPLALPDALSPAFLTGGPVAGFLFVTAARPPRSRRRRTAGTAGSLVVVVPAVLAVASSAATSTLLTAASVIPAFRAGLPDGGSGRALGAAVGAVVGLGVAAAGFLVHARATATARVGAHWSTVVAAWIAAAGVVAVAGLPFTDAAITAAVALGVAATVALAVKASRRMLVPTTRVPLLLGGHGALVLGAIASWHSSLLAVTLAAGVLGALTLFARTVPASARWVYVGAGYAYALTVAAAGFDLLGLPDTAVLSLTTSVGAVIAIVSTFLRVVPVRTWWTILAVTSVPFAIGILQVVRERSGWTALSTGLIFLLALALVVTRRPGLVAGLRAACAALLVPSLSVVVICLGAQVLSVSASPITLPVIAVVVALTLPTTDMAAALLVRRGMAAVEATLVRVAIEASALLTGALAVALALVRDAAGLPTAVAVLVILAAGAAAGALTTRHVRLWWVAAAAATGAMWSVWRIAEIDLLEPYVLPPALGAVLVGTILTARGRPAVALVASGIGVAIAPSLIALAVSGAGWRMSGLLAAAIALYLAAERARGTARLSALRVPLLAGALLAAASGPVGSVRLGAGLDAVPTGWHPVVLGFGLSMAGGLLALVAGRSLAREIPDERRWRERWVLAPAALFVTGGAWPLISEDWLSIWAMWALLLAILVGVVGVAIRVRRSPAGILPPIWFLFALAFTTAVVAWSPRELRVEWFSLPLGAALLVAGAVHLDRAPVPERGTWTSWPARWVGSWPLLAPGLLTIMSASILATFTDPLTWRAILVIVMALAAILVGARWRLSAPFLLGIAVLPIENVSAFAVQIGRGIASMPWWITLAVVGAVLLIIAVSYERRAGEAEGIGARLRDLR
ncbi:hypothetical protein LJR045_001651 [Microbacterium sp. LjRoot45]|uniref:SCO7613 C-terminal domain-containing membrane protein n=1 Tax=Microbacterium sp. LjRoot45 TaxID=3342329 RepID=UPI003ECDBF15